MTIVPSGSQVPTPHARFAPPPWHDQHPERLALEARLAPDHLARSVDAAVARLDLETLHAAYAGTGSLAHPPELLLRAILFENKHGYHSPALWYLHATESEPLRWLLRGCVPSRSCWYAFRDRIAPLLHSLNAQPLHQAVAAGLTPATHGANDGTLIAANASRHRLLNEATLTKRLAALDAVLAADTAPPAALPADDTAPPAALPADDTAPPAALPADDTIPPAALPADDTVPPAALPADDTTTPAALPADDTVPPAALPPDNPVAPPTPVVPAWMARLPATRLAQRQRYARAQEHLAQRHARNRRKPPSKRTPATRVVVSVSDPEAALGLDKEDVYRPLYNVQVVDDLDSPFVLGYEVFAQPGDAGLLGTMLQRTQELTGRGLQTILADTTYANGADLQAAAAADVTVYAPLPKEPAGPTAQVPKSAFTWLPEEQTYVCPQGHRLALEATGPRSRTHSADVEVRRYRCPPEHCTGCPLGQKCARKPEAGRTVSRGDHEELVEALRSRMETAAGQTLYRQRRQTVELVNADWKTHRKLRRFSGRGLQRARCQVGLMVLTHNLLTLLAEETKAKAAKDTAVNPEKIVT
jgi:transposase